MKKKIFSIIAAAMLIATMVPSIAFAAGAACDGGSECSHEVAIGTKHYDTFSAAVADATNGDTLKLLKNVTMDKTYFGANAGQTLTLDLNGYELTRTWQDWGPGADTTTKSVIYNQGTLTIKDSSTSKSGKIKGHADTSGATGWNQEFKGAAISNAPNAIINIEGGTITRGDENSFGYYTVYNKGTINMSGGLIVNGSCASAMVCNVAGESTFNMTGGKLSQKNFQTLKNETGSTVRISGGTLESDDRTLQNYGTATISGGDMKGDIQIPASGNLSMTNGNVTGELYGNGAATISGGVFSQPVPDRFCATDYVPIQNEDGSYGVVIPVMYNITVNNGTATVNEVEADKAYEGDAIAISAGPAPNGKVFDKWEIAGIDTTSVDLKNKTIEFTMPANDVTATAKYIVAADSATKTGDNANFALWIALMIIAAVGITGTMLYRRKYNA